MIQFEQQQHGEFVGGVADFNYLYPARWGWIKNKNCSSNISDVEKKRKKYIFWYLSFLKVYSFNGHVKVTLMASNF